MKGRKKQRGAKDYIRAYKKRLRYIATVVTVIILASIIAFISFLIYSYLKPSSTQPKAAIVDHLSLTAPNPTFTQTATNILETANFTVDYYPGKEVSVDFYRNLPTRGYDIIILRVHSVLQSYEKVSPVVLFTSERYSPAKHVLEQSQDRVGVVAYSTEEAEGGIMYFGITPSFVKYSMKGTFDGTTIVMMGCDGLRYETMAEAFVEKKDAKVYISWSGGVSASHTDLATTKLLEHLITERKTIKQAVTETMNEVGPDPADESVLLYYPDTLVDNYVIPNIAGNLIMNDATISGYDSQSSLRHVHCPRCGKIITHTP